MENRSRSVVSNLKRLIGHAFLAGIIGMVLGVVVGYVVTGSLAFTALTAVVCAAIGVWYVVWEMEPPSRS